MKQVAIAKITNKKSGITEGESYIVTGEDSGSAHKTLIQVKTEKGNVWTYKDNFTITMN